MSKLFTSSPWIRRTATSCHRRLSTQATQPIALHPTDRGNMTLEAFRDLAFKTQKPMVLGKDVGSPSSLLPAMNKWFEKQPLHNSTTLSAHIGQFHDTWFPYEILASSPRQKQSTAAFRRFLASEEPEDEAITRSWDACFADPIGSQAFFQFHAPLRLLIKALAFNQVQGKEGQEPLELYIAQSSLTDLPPALQEDVPTPELVQRVGKGDVYNSSVWLGTEPTYTPLHRDPNPNIFCQLCSNKVIRLMAPRVGDILFSQVQRRIQKRGNSRIRTDEMMQGEEREALYDAVWGAGPSPTGTYEADLGPGDALFIPNGWWHSVKSKGTNGHLNGSVNWWFR